ncbi:EamA family transporter [Labrenzia sp. 011]|uniref:aromatic amino acid exporter YddG n=1 Tax=Labrenzia sp. 011 TaxID=2171494 RepID=UPI000D51E5DA|nr:EamA family transporter [Labrenzia sp. 011]PVB62076.1 EamA family transporter [Labrenzia sp. 011]
MARTGRTKATGIGLSAVLMWATLGLFGAGSGQVPPFLLNALCFGISGSLAFVWLLATGRVNLLRQPPKVWAFGTLGLFGFHFFYFTAIRNAPPVEANLINYTWPLLIVLFSAFLPGEHLRLHHVIGTVLGLAGAVLLITGGDGIAFSGGSALGYAAAVASCLFWSSYSVLSRRLGSVPTEAVAGFCLVTALLSGLCHVMLEQTVWPAGGLEWASLLGLALFPVGLAFFTWDIGVKHGDIQVLGAAAYSAPLLSTLLLIAFGFGALTLPVAIACVAITVGALIAAKDMIFRKRQGKTAADPAGDAGLPPSEHSTSSHDPLG